MPSFDSCAFSTKSVGKLPNADIRATARRYEKDGLAPADAMLKALQDRLDLALLDEKRISAAVRSAYDKRVDTDPESDGVRYSTSNDRVPSAELRASVLTQWGKVVDAVPGYEHLSGVVRKGNRGIFIFDGKFDRDAFKKAMSEAQAAGLDTKKLYIIADSAPYTGASIDFFKFADFAAGSITGRRATIQGELFSASASPLAATPLRMVNPFVRKLADAGKIVLHDDASTLPIKGRAPAGVQALTTREGTIHVVANALGANARGIVLHEAFHAGGEALVGSAAWGKLMKRLDNLHALAGKNSGAVGEFFSRARDRVAAAKGKGAVAEGMTAEEFGAYTIEEYAKAPASLKKWVDDLLGAVKAWALARFGAQLGEVTPAQLSALAQMALLDVQATRMEPSFSAITKTDTPEFRRWFGKSKVVDENGAPLRVYHGTSADDVTEFRGRPDERSVVRKALNRLGLGYGEMNVIEPKAAPKNGRKIVEAGATWFTSSPDLAGAYAGEPGRQFLGDDKQVRDAAPNILPVYLSLQKPVIYDATEQTMTMPDGTVRDMRVLFDGQERYASSWVVANPVAMHAARTNGGDGVIFRGVYDSPNMTEMDNRHDTYVTFKPEQIKSATGNNGDYDPANPDIRYSTDRRTHSIEVQGKRRPIENSRGQLIAADMNQQLAFYRFFKDSKVVDEQQRPMVVYHGTRATGIESFKEGTFFAENKDLAERFYDGKRGNSNAGARTLYAAYLSIQNPLDLRTIPVGEQVDAQTVAAAVGIPLAQWRALIEKHGAKRMQEAGKTPMPGAGLSINDLGTVSWTPGGKDSDKVQAAKWKQRFWEVIESPTVQAVLQELGYDGVRMQEQGSALEAPPKGMTKKNAPVNWREAVQSDTWLVFKPEQIKSATGNAGTFDPANADIRYSVGAPRPAAAWTAPEATRIDKIVHTLQNKHIDMKRVVDEIRKTGAAIEDKWDPYLQEELFHGRSATGFKEFLNGELRPLLVDMQARGVKIEDFEHYLVMRHAEETNEHIAAINPEMPDGGSGTMTADARAYLANLPATKATAYQALAARVDAMVKSTQQVLLDYGLEKQEVIDAWNGAYKHYVPLQREDMDTMLAGAGTGQGFSIRGSAAKRRTGSDKAVIDVLANIAMAREQAIVRGEKNRLDLALYGLALKAPNPEFWKPINPKKNPAGLQAELLAMGLPGVLISNYMDAPTKKVVVPRAGGTQAGQQTIPGAAKRAHEEVVRVKEMLHQKKNVVMVRVDGEDRFIFFNDKDERALRMAMSLKNLTGGELNWFLENVGKATRWFASINTQYNPIFGIVNLLRDSQSVMLNLTSTPLNGRQGEVMGDISNMLWKAGIKGFRMESLTGPDAAIWEEFQREGGITGYRAMFTNSDERAEELRSELSRMSDGTLKKGGRAVMDWLSDYNEALENITRLAVYKAAKAQGMTAQRAASMAKNATVNFNRKGAVSSQIGALYAFFNAATQGTVRLAETLDPRTTSGKAIIAGGLLLGVMQAVMLAAAGFEDEPPEFIKAKNIVIPIGAISGKKDYVTVPMPLGFNVLPTISRIATEFMLGGGKKPAKHIANMAGAVADGFNPIGNAGFSMQTILPTVIDPLAALESNRDYTGKKIYNEDRSSLSPTPGHTRARGAASIPAKLASEGINWVTGGNDYVPGMVSPTPEHLEYLTGQLTGGVGREVMKAFKTGQALATGEELPVHTIPLAGRFYGSTEDGATVRDHFTQHLKDLNLLEQEYTGRLEDKAGAKEFKAANPLLVMADQAQAVQKQVADLNKEKRRLMEKGAPRERIRLMDDKMRGLMEKFNGKVAERKKLMEGAAQ